MADTYTTKSGDAWDAIARAVYGSENYMSYLIRANPELADTFIFSDGITLRTPPLPVARRATSVPIWRDGT